MKRKAFTLIELLVVIAIIAILAAMILPVIGRAIRGESLAEEPATEVWHIKRDGNGNVIGEERVQ